jgi:hypothetical protein
MGRLGRDITRGVFVGAMIMILMPIAERGIKHLYQEACYAMSNAATARKNRKGNIGF